MGLLYLLFTDTSTPKLHLYAYLFINTSEPRGYSTPLRFWPVDDFAQLAAWPTGSREVARGGCFMCLEFHCAKVSCTYGGGQKTLDQM
jgi:hypothetical protein